MIELTKINGELIVVNSRLIEYIVAIPETKIIMNNGRYHLVMEPPQEIIRKVIAFEQKVAEGWVKMNCWMAGEYIANTPEEEEKGED